MNTGRGRIKQVGKVLSNKEEGMMDVTEEHVIVVERFGLCYTELEKLEEATFVPKKHQ